MLSSKSGQMLIASLVTTVLAVLPNIALGQFEPWSYSGWIESGFEAQELHNYDWAKWLVGEWEGWAQGGDDRAPQRQTFQITTNGRYLLTQLERGSNGEIYKGMGVFAYDTENDVSYGEWFGGFGDRNDGRGQRDGSKWVWHINRHGRKITRIITRVDENHFIASSEIAYPDGRIRHTREEMVRVK